MKKVILASLSPRRKELLKSIVDEFTIIPSNVDETYPPSLNPFDVSLYISDLKAADVYKDNIDSIVVGCDTTIVFEDRVIGKPIDKEDAKKTLMGFSNKLHYVVSGVTIYSDNQKYQINSVNKVYFKNISEEEINKYLEFDEYKDKAGSYAIQGLANKFIEKIEGEYEAIVGLPIKELIQLLNSINQ